MKPTIVDSTVRAREDFSASVAASAVNTCLSTHRRGAVSRLRESPGGRGVRIDGSEEGDLKPFVGQRVAITGTRKAAEIDTATGRPTGGRQAGYDLRLFEVDVESFRAAPVQARTVARLGSCAGGARIRTTQ